MRAIVLSLLAATLAGCGGDGESPIWGTTGGGREIGTGAAHSEFAPAPEQPPMPTPVLRAKRIPVRRAKYPAIDFHFHAGDWAAAADQMTRMEEFGIGMICNMDGGFGDRLATAQRNAAMAEGRLINFARVDWEGINEEGWADRAAATLAAAFEGGAMALKVSKRLGMTMQNPDGSYILPDDPRLDAVWQTCAEFERPVMIHSSDPPARWQRIGPDNERYEAGMWRSSPDGNYHGSLIPNYMDLLSAQERLVARHPRTVFVGGHVGSRAWDLNEVARLLDAYPNYYVEISARLQELGRQPYTSRRFLIKYADRVLFGSDGNPRRGEDFWVPHWRFLETDDEYFDHPAQMRGPGGAGLQGRWKIHGVYLPDDVLKKIYYENALTLLPPEVRAAFERM